MLFAFDVAASLFAWWWVMSKVARSSWESKPPTMCKSIAKNWLLKASGNDDRPAERPYIVTMPTIYGGEGIDNYASWVIGMAELLDCDLIFFFCGIRIDVNPASTVESCFHQWLRVFNEVNE